MQDDKRHKLCREIAQGWQVSFLKFRQYHGINMNTHWLFNQSYNWRRLYPLLQMYREKKG